MSASLSRRRTATSHAPPVPGAGVQPTQDVLPGPASRHQPSPASNRVVRGSLISVHGYRVAIGSPHFPGHAWGHTRPQTCPLGCLCRDSCRSGNIACRASSGPRGDRSCRVNGVDVAAREQLPARLPMIPGRCEAGTPDPLAPVGPHSVLCQPMPWLCWSPCGEHRQTRPANKRIECG